MSKSLNELASDLLPENAIPLGIFRVITYLDQDGEWHLKFKYDGDDRVDQTIGAIEIAKQLYITDCDLIERLDDE